MIQQPAGRSDMLRWHEKWNRSDRVAAGFAHGFALSEIWSGSWQSCGGDRMDRSQGIRYFVRARATHKQLDNRPTLGAPPPGRGAPPKSTDELNPEQSMNGWGP